MSLPAPTLHNDDLEVTDKLDATVLTSKLPVIDDPAVSESGISIELNFKAFADHVPPTKHAKRVGTHLDPSIQDFADQALEIAALRAELNRLARDYDALLQTSQRRDQYLQSARDEVANSRKQLREMSKQLSELRSIQSPTPGAQVAEPPAAPAALAPKVVEPVQAAITGQTPAGVEPTTALPILQAAEPPQQIATVEIPGLAKSDPREATAALHEALNPATTPEISASAAPRPLALLQLPPRHLQPVDHDGQPIPLDRDILTIGRTNKSDVCIASRAISRDHARLLVARNSVTVIDMDSGNGCFVNAERVSKCRLREGDILTIGDRSYRLVRDTPPERASP